MLRATKGARNAVIKQLFCLIKYKDFDIRIVSALCLDNLFNFIRLEYIRKINLAAVVFYNDVRLALIVLGGGLGVYSFFCGLLAYAVALCYAL